MTEMAAGYSLAAIFFVENMKNFLVADFNAFFTDSVRESPWF